MRATLLVSLAAVVLPLAAQTPSTPPAPAAKRTVQLLFGQESPLVAERSPRSLASVGFPDFAAAGNLWLWVPQVRATLEQGYTLRLAEQVAVLAPTSGTAQQGLFATQPDSAER